VSRRTKKQKPVETVSTKPEDPARLELKATLARHGFHYAAIGLPIYPFNYRRMIASWDDFPQCMAKYPKYIRK
jgi:hypothetical protein